METFWSEAIVLDAALISVLLALWITSFGLRGLFWLMAAVGRAPANRIVQPIRVSTNLSEGNRSRHAA